MLKEKMRIEKKRKFAGKNGSKKGRFEGKMELKGQNGGQGTKSRLQEKRRSEEKI